MDSSEAFVGLTAGVDHDGQPVRLGERDSMGHVVGFIDEDGTCWESLAERDSAVTAGVYRRAVEAYQWQQIPEHPDADAIAQEVCLDPRHYEEAAREAREQLEFYEAIRAKGSFSAMSPYKLAPFLLWIMNNNRVIEGQADAQRLYLEYLEERDDG